MNGASIDLRDRVGLVRDQGERGTCVAFAASAAHEISLWNDTTIDLSEEVLYWGCKQVDGVQGEGTTLDAARLSLIKWGQPEEHLWPYVPLLQSAPASSAPPPDAIDPANCYKLALRPVGRAVPDVKQELLSGKAVVMALPIWMSFFQPASDGHLSMPQATEPYCGNHAVTAVGFDSPGKSGHFIIRNSWGDGWGVGGYGYLPYDYFAKHGHSAWTWQ